MTARCNNGQYIFTKVNGRFKMVVIIDDIKSINNLDKYLEHKFSTILIDEGRFR